MLEYRLRWRSDDVARGSAGDRMAEDAITHYLADKVRAIRDGFGSGPPPGPSTAQADMAAAIVDVFLRRHFLYQSVGRVAHLLPAMRERMAKAMARGAPLPVYFLYHGGYRASSRPDALDPVFSPDQTELLLLYQAARLQSAVQAIYPPGISLAIVINNGVAAYTNDIPCRATEDYVRRLRALIAALGAEGAVWVLVQSEMSDFLADMASTPCPPAVAISGEDHGIVERFLGRRCTEAEARARIARYGVAEAAWGERLQPIIDRASGIFLRQVAHPACLSFRPFPGAATRVQNGEVGFRSVDPVGRLLPVLISGRTARMRPVVDLTVDLAAIVPNGFPTE